MAKTVVIRLSAMGDVAMTIPVIYSAAGANPQDSFTVLTQSPFTPLFVNRPANVDVRGVDLQSRERSVYGFLLFVWRLRRESFDSIIDLHGNLRSRLASIVFWLSGKPVYRIDKGRRERRQLTARPPKTIRPLRAVAERYADVFRAAGYTTDGGTSFVSLYKDLPANETVWQLPDGLRTKTDCWIGVAPFARHKGKIYPLEKMEQAVAELSRREGVTLFLFGSRKEAAILNGWAARYDHTVSVAGRYPLDAELALMSRLDVLASMDSSNMHLASLVSVKVVSIWGATHPYAGFVGFGQGTDNIVQADLPCRPCSIYGNKPCRTGNCACLAAIAPEEIVDAVVKASYRRSQLQHLDAT